MLIKISVKVAHKIPAHKMHPSKSVGGHVRPEIRMRVDRASHLVTRVLQPSADSGLGFRPGHAHLARVITSDDAVGAPRGHELAEVRGGHLPPECKKRSCQNVGRQACGVRAPAYSPGPRAPSHVWRGW